MLGLLMDLKSTGTYDLVQEILNLKNLVFDSGICDFKEMSLVLLVYKPL